MAVRLSAPRAGLSVLYTVFHIRMEYCYNRPTRPGTPPGILLSAASGGPDAPVMGATTSQLARVLTSGILVAQVTGTGRPFGF
jgi:hypothetical protein